MIGFRIHLVGGVGVHRLVAGRGDAALFVEELDGLEGPGRERRALEAFRICVPVLVHVSAQRDETAARNFAMLLFPRHQVGDREGVVRVFGEIRRVVEHDQRQDHLLERDLVHGDAVLGKMRRRIDMRAVLPDHIVIGGAEAVVLDGVGPLGLGVVGRRERGLPEARPDRRRRSRSYASGRRTALRR